MVIEDQWIGRYTKLGGHSDASQSLATVVEGPLKAGKRNDDTHDRADAEHQSRRAPCAYVTSRNLPHVCQSERSIRPLGIPVPPPQQTIPSDRWLEQHFAPSVALLHAYFAGLLLFDNLRRGQALETPARAAAELTSQKDDGYTALHHSVSRHRDAPRRSFRGRYLRPIKVASSDDARCPMWPPSKRLELPGHARSALTACIRPSRV